MSNSWFDKSFNGVDDGFFDDVLEYFDFPLEDVEDTDGGGGGGGGSSVDPVRKDFDLPLNDVEEKNSGSSGSGDEELDYLNFQNLEPPPANVLAGLSSGFYGDFFGDTVSCDGSSQLNKLSSTKEASLSKSIAEHSESADVKGSVRFQTSSPVSVLESSSSCSAANSAPINPELCFLVKRSRSKRRPVSAFSLQFLLPLISPAYSTSRGSNSLVGSESETESHLTRKSTIKRQKKKKNLTILSGSSELKNSPSQQPIIVRKCMHCEVTKTPQWREGPMGPKTLCNACGVRYRSGRLFPEYRPAASPTFVPSLHSNSHKKVVEMRKQASCQ